MRRFLWLASVGLLVAAACGRSPIEVPVHQPIDFPHGEHLTYFASGEHRTEGIAVHREVVDLDDLPAELVEGRCAECHSEAAEMLACAGCHVQSQNEALRKAKDVRKCVGCHRGAWGASAATLPSAAGCLACHKDGVQLASADGGGSRVDKLVEDVPWMRINTMPANVYFSHTAHVRYAAMPCTQCHQDVTALKSPPTLVTALTMTDCLTCHVKNGVSTDCLTCHK